MREYEKERWNGRQWKKIYVKYFLKYLIGFCIILFPCISITYFSWRITRDQVVMSGQIRLQEGMAEISSNISKMRIIENNIQNDSSFQRLSKIEESIPWGEYMQLYYANRRLNDIRHIYTFSPFYFVLFDKNELFTSSYQCDEKFSDRFYGKFMNAYQNGEWVPPQQFREMILNTEDKVYSFIPFDSISYFFELKQQIIQRPILCVIQDVQIKTSKPSHHMGFVITEETLLQLLLTKECQEDGFIRITDSGGRVLLDYGNTDEIVEKKSEIQDIGAYWMLTAKDKEETGWSVQIGIPKTVIAVQMKNLYHLVWAYIILGILLVFSISYFFSLKQYQRLRKFYALIPERECEEPNGRNEYEVILKIYREMANNSDCYQRQKEELDRQNQAIRLESLIVRGITTQEEKKELEHAGIVFSEFYCVVVMRMLVKNEEEYGFVLLSIVEYLKESWSEQISHVHTGINDELFLFSMPPTGVSNVSEIQRLLEGIVYILTEDMEVTMGVGISAIGTGISNLRRCYEQARQVLEAYYRKGKNTIAVYHIDLDNSRDTIISMEFLDKLYHFILCSHQEELQKWFEQLNMYYHRMPVQFEAQKEQIFYSIRNVLYNAQLHLPGNLDEVERLPIYQKGDSIDQMTETLQRAAYGLICEVKKRKKEENEEFHEEILTYMEQNFMDKNMSVSFICRNKGISERYLQSVIKEKTGDTFSVYLERLRIKRAAELLLSTDWSNERIAESVGFTAVSTFYRVFNKQIGVSPKVYRNQGE